jgi:5'-deoxynucleotidase YfbR-like HD superfamily hydrolase
VIAVLRKGRPAAHKGVVTDTRQPIAAPARAWQRMLSGRVLDLVDPAPEAIEIEDIAHGLSRVARWNGQTRGEQAFSVAQHCCLVADIFVVSQPRATQAERLAALLHDGPEYVIGDLISPFKAVIGPEYRQLEKRLLGAIHRRFGIGALAAATALAIKRADAIAAWHEATALAGFSQGEAAELFGDGSEFHPPADALPPLAPAGAARRFLKRFRQFGGGRDERADKS